MAKPENLFYSRPERDHRGQLKSLLVIVDHGVRALRCPQSTVTNISAPEVRSPQAAAEISLYHRSLRLVVESPRRNAVSQVSFPCFIVEDQANGTPVWISFIGLFVYTLATMIMVVWYLAWHIGPDFYPGITASLLRAALLLFAAVGPLYQDYQGLKHGQEPNLAVAPLNDCMKSCYLSDVPAARG